MPIPLFSTYCMKISTFVHICIHKNFLSVLTKISIEMFTHKKSLFLNYSVYLFYKLRQYGSELVCLYVYTAYIYTYIHTHI